MATWMTLTLALALVTCEPGPPRSFQPPATGAETGSLERLTGKTGWIPLGDVTVDGKHWASGSDPTVDFLTGPFEILGKAVDRHTPVLPKAGERIKLTARVPVLILDFATTGEKRALDAPSAVSRSKGPDDRTGLILAPGSIVEVRAVAVSGPHGRTRAVWARVSPVAR